MTPQAALAAQIERYRQMTGELRVSNFLLWQISYAELWVTDVLWPDFRGDELLASCQAYAARERKFGGLPSLVAPG